MVILKLSTTFYTITALHILSKISNLEYPWVRKLSENTFHSWKVTPLYLINTKFENFFGISFEFNYISR